MSTNSIAATADLQSTGCNTLPGALVIGGDHPGLGVVRSLGRRGIPVYVIDDRRCISSYSCYTTRVVCVENILDERKTVETVFQVGRKYNLRNWVLIPTRDETVAAFSRYRSQLSEFFTVTTCNWEAIQWAWDKKKTYELAEALGISYPRTFHPRGLNDLPLYYSKLPLAIKPAVKENFFYATGAKAWRANSEKELRELYCRASRQIRPEEILLQEIIPGGGQEQLSYCAFVLQGRPQSVLTAKRVRQHPREFGRAATYVETVAVPQIEELAERFLRAIGYHGLVEIEFKRDPRDGQYKLLDVNARAWGFHSLGSACGVDFPYLLYAESLNLPIEPVRAKAGVGWLRLITDVPTAAADFMHGNLTLRDYIRSLRAARIESVFSWDDPIPWLAEIAVLPLSVVKKRASSMSSQTKEEMTTS